MRDAIEIQDVVFDYNGKSPDSIKTYLTTSNEIYIGLGFNGVWVNISAKDIHKYVKKINGAHSSVG